MRRQGQMTKAQRRAFRELWPRFGLEFRYGELLDTGHQPVVLEIGFGRGENLIAMAQAEPDRSFLGIETHKPGLANALIELDRNGIDNVRLVRGDGRLVLTDYLREHSVSEIFILFPDPWPNSGDAHRRLVQPGFLDTIRQRLDPDGSGFVHVATDVSAYADHVRAVFQDDPDWESVPVTDENRRLVTTRYEARAIEEGREIWDGRWRTLQKS